MPSIKSVILGFFCLIFFFFPFKTFSFYSDDFTGNALDVSKWNVTLNSGLITVDQGKVILSGAIGGSPMFPYVYSKPDIFPEAGPFSIQINYKYLAVGGFGDGITISADRYPGNGVDPGSDIPGYITFSVWQSADYGLYTQKVLCNSDSTGCNTLELLNIVPGPHDLNPHEIKIIYSDTGEYSIYYDGADTPKYISDINQRRPKYIWFGNSVGPLGIGEWSPFEIYNITVNTIENQVEKNPVIVLPGFGGSWDIGAILDGTAGNNWKVPSFVKNYDGIMQSFRNAGYVDNTDLFIFPYDWRKPLTNLADDLKSYIDGTNLTGKIDLIGHSMGGLVARSYAQKHGIEKVNRILTAGSPHLGVIDTYGLWEGAKIWDGVWWENVLLEIATEVNSQTDESKVAAIRRVSPSIIDLFPTVPFLISGEVTQGIDTMIQKNSYLSMLNQDVGALGDKLTPFWSDDINVTKNNIRITTRSDTDSQEGKWEDGKPIEGDAFGKTLGDGTVTKESAVGPFGTGEKLTGWHGDLLSTQNNIGKIFQNLELDPDFAVSSETDSRRKSFVAILRSPGTLEVCDKFLINCNDQLGLYFPEFKLFILPGYEDDDLLVKVKESGLGSYTLHVGKVENEGWWNRAVGNLETVGQVDKYLVTGSDMIINIVNNPPVLSVIGSKSTDELRTLSFTAIATDTDSSDLSFGLAGAPTGAIIDQTTGDFSFTPSEAQGPGTYTFAISVSDGNSTDSEEITITVNEVNVLPTANDISVSTDEDISKAISLTATDTDLPKNTLTYSIISSPSHGAVSLSGDLATYTPADNYHGTDSFTFKVRDSLLFDPLLTNPFGIGTVSVTINSINDAPVASDVSVSTGQEVPVTIELSGSDVEDNSLTYSIVSNGVHGTLGNISNNRIIYSPNGGFSGTDSFTFKINDGSLESHTATANIKVDPPPQILDEMVNAPSETGATIVWNTNHPSTSRVIYGTVSHPILGDAPNYGYANSTVEKDDSLKVTSHTVTITGLTAGTTYYYRAVSHGSPEAVGVEKSFTTKGTKLVNSFEDNLVKIISNISKEVLGEATEATSSPTPIISKVYPLPQVLGETQDIEENFNWWWLSLLIVLLYLIVRHLLNKKVV